MNDCTVCGLSHHPYEHCADVLARARKRLKDGPPTFGVVCVVCVQIHTSAVTCASLRDDIANAEVLRAREEAVISAWRPAIEEAWSRAQVRALLEIKLAR